MTDIGKHTGIPFNRIVASGMDGDDPPLAECIAERRRLTKEALANEQPAVIDPEEWGFTSKDAMERYAKR